MQKISKVLLVLMAVMLITSCSRYQKRPLVEIPGSQKVVVKKGPLVKEEPSPLVKGEKGVFYPDPTRGFIENESYNLFIKVWLNPSFEKGKVKGAPDFDLPPKAIVEAVMPLGERIVYALGRMKTRVYCWQSIGAVNRKIPIDSQVRYNGHYGWKVVFCQSEFSR